MKKLYRLLLFFYPARFREEYSGPLERQFLDEYRDAPGTGGRLVLLLRALADLAFTLPAEMARELRQDAGYAVRVSRKRALSTSLALTALALAIGAATGVFSVVNALLLRSLPFHDAERLMIEQQVIPGFDLEAASLADWTRNSSYLADAGPYRAGDMNLLTRSGSVRVKVAQTTAGFFRLLGAEPAFGRAFAANEAVAGSDQVAVISHAVWQQLFGANPRVLGATIRLNGVPLTVIGVAAPTFDFPNQTAVWTPTVYDRDRIPNSGMSTAYTVGRLKPGVSLTQANQMAYAELARAYPKGVDQRDRTRWTSLRDQLAGPVRQASLVLLAVVVLVLLIACSNVAQLLLSRTTERRPELTIRAALGASRARLVQQLITEGVLLTLLAAASGLLVARWAARLAVSVQPPALLTQQYSLLDWRVLVFTASLALLTGVVFGVLPAVLIGRMQPSADSLRTHRAPGANISRMRSQLLALQTALAVILIAGSLSMGRSFLKLVGTDLGFRTPNVATMTVHLEGTPEEPDARAAVYYREALDRLRQVPGVEAAGAADYLPLTVTTFYVSHPIVDNGVAPWGVPMVVTPGYFPAMRTTLVAGRDFTDGDRRGSLPVAIVDEEFARASGLGSAIVGHKMTSVFGPPDDKPFTVVGIVRTTRLTPASEKHSQIYYSSAQIPSGYATFVARVHGDPERYLPVLRDAIRQVDGDVPVYDLQTFDQRLRKSLARPRFYTTAILFFGGFALLLAVIGAYAASSYSISQRTHEIGVRIAVGAYPQRLRATLLRQSMVPIVAGMLAGVAGAAALGRFLQHLISSAEATGAVTCAAAALALAMTGAIAVWSATGRIVRMDPTAALRAE